VVDTVAPVATIDDGPSGLVSSSSATFFFSAAEAATFQCSLDGAAYSACTGSRSYSALADGPHTFRVYANDGLRDGPVATRSWTVDTTPPGARIVGGPPSGLPVQSTSVTFGLISDENGATFSCRFDGGAWAPCTSPVILSGLTPGDHELDARATDAAGNTGCPRKRTFTSTRSGTVSLTQFRTTLRPGAKLTIRVSTPGATPATKILTIRKSKPPTVTTG
jgi:large repetitive protein